MQIIEIKRNNLVVLKNRSKHISFVILLCPGLFSKASIRYACAKRGVVTNKSPAQKNNPIDLNIR